MKWELRPQEMGKVVGGVEATSLEDVGCGQKYLCKDNMGKVLLSLQYCQ